MSKAPSSAAHAGSRFSAMDTGSICDLRSALEFLAAVPGQLATVRQPVDAHAELAAVYRRSGAGPALRSE